MIVDGFGRPVQATAEAANCASPQSNVIEDTPMPGWTEELQQNVELETGGRATLKRKSEEHESERSVRRRHFTQGR